MWDICWVLWRGVVIPSRHTNAVFVLSGLEHYISQAVFFLESSFSAVTVRLLSAGEVEILLKWQYIYMLFLLTLHRTLSSVGSNTA